MSAANALKAARAAGISLAIEGNKLVVEAPTPPSPEIVENISRHKAEILNLLRSAAAAWSAADWQAFFDERAGILEHDGRLDRLDAEMYCLRGLRRSLAGAASTGRTRARTLPPLWQVGL